MRLQLNEGVPPRLQYHGCQPSSGRQETFSDVLWRARAKTAPAGSMSARLRSRPAEVVPEPEPEPEPALSTETSEARIGIHPSSAIACIEQLLGAEPRRVAAPPPTGGAQPVSWCDLTSDGDEPASHAAERPIQPHNASPETSVRGEGASDGPHTRASAAVGPAIGASGNVEVGSAILRSSSAETLDRVLARARVRQMSSGGSRLGSGGSNRFQARQRASALEMSMFVASRHTAASDIAAARLDSLLYPKPTAAVDAADDEA